MKPYDAQRAYMRQYFGPSYPHVIAVRGHIPIDWMTKNLKATYTYTVDNDMGRDYQQTIIGYGIHGVQDRPGENLYLFHDLEHVRQIVAAMPELIVTTDPFGPDICPACSGLSVPLKVVEVPPARITGWRRLVASAIGIPTQ